MKKTYTQFLLRIFRRIQPHMKNMTRKNALAMNEFFFNQNNIMVYIYNNPT